MNNLVNDPVCHMEVHSESFAIEYEGIHHAFCSIQCKERFLSNPHLYIGFPGHKAPAQQGMELIKKHCLVLSIPLDVMQAEYVKRALTEMMGIHEVGIEGDKIEIQYDLMQVNAEQISDKLGSIGIELGGGWIDHLKLAFINNMEETEVGSLEVRIDNHCH